MNEYVTHEKRMEQFPLYKAGFEYCFHHYGSDDYDGEIQHLEETAGTLQCKVKELSEEVSKLNKTKKKLSKRIKSYEKLYHKFINIGEQNDKDKNE